ncbi:MAG: Ig-like domain-containing protein [Ruminococcus sp.]|nr:Ig-like domain-containing protein [Ruminococcus sp.]
MIKKMHAIISVALALVLVLGTFACMAFTASAEDDDCPLNDQGLVKDIEGGNILHCWCWNFNTIKENIPKIAEAGYSAVQTSPINEVYKGHGGGLQIYGTGGRWYYHYQPTNYTIGNYQLGTESEFKAMCETAHSYGVKVIVDVVANHTTTATNSVSGSLRYIQGGLYHNNGNIPNGSTDRYDMTQKCLSALPDCNTQNENYQNVILNYLKKCVTDGADGFRFDAAKHIELPTDDASYASDFWPTVLENDSTFQYGEVLQSTNSHFSDYSKIMHVTASTHGGTLRTYFKNGCSTMSATSFIGYNSEGVKGNRLVTWVESHDTYANDEEVKYPTLSSFWMTNDEIRRGWALISSRKNSTSLFFNRPAGSEPTTDEDLDENPRWGNNKIGDAGDDNWNHPEVVAVNKFRNAMWGESEKLENINSKYNLIMITRGTRGAVIINNSSTDLVLDGQATNMVDGSYTDKAHGSEFTVSGGKLSGTVKAKEIAVIYDESIKPTYPTEAPTTESTETQATQAPETAITVKAAKTSIKIDDQTAVKAVVTNGSGSTTFTSSNSAVAKVTSQTASACTVKGIKAGKATITATNNGVSAKVVITVSKKANTMTVKAKACSAKAKKNTTIKKAKAFTIKNAKGKVTFKKASGDKKITINKKTGNITVKKGLKKGKTYKLSVKVTAAGNTAYKPVTKSVTVKIKIK